MPTQTRRMSKAAGGPTFVDLETVGEDKGKRRGSGKTHPKVADNESEYEFFGPPGAAFIVISLPLVVYALYYLASPDGRLLVSLSPPRIALPELQFSWSSLFEIQAFAVIVGWFVFQVFLERVLPGKVVEGVVLSNGKRLKYTMNGFLAFLCTLVLCIVGYTSSVLPLSYIYDHFLSLLTATIIFSFALSLYLYFEACQPGRLLARGGQTDSSVYNFFIGKELNPRIGTFDLKCFCELRPGLIGWVIINLGMAAKQYEVESFGTFSKFLIL